VQATIFLCNILYELVKVADEVINTHDDLVRPAKGDFDGPLEDTPKALRVMRVEG
jgi:hypothetical protein